MYEKYDGHPVYEDVKRFNDEQLQKCIDAYEEADQSDPDDEYGQFLLHTLHVERGTRLLQDV